MSDTQNKFICLCVIKKWNSVSNCKHHAQWNLYVHGGRRSLGHVSQVLGLLQTPGRSFVSTRGENSFEIEMFMSSLPFLITDRGIPWRVVTLVLIREKFYIYHPWKVYYLCYFSTFFIKTFGHVIMWNEEHCVIGNLYVYSTLRYNPQ